MPCVEFAHALELLILFARPVTSLHLSQPKLMFVSASTADGHVPSWHLQLYDILAVEPTWIHYADLLHKPNSNLHCTSTLHLGIGKKL